MIFLQRSDFTGGKYDIPDAIGVYTSADVQAMLDSYEKQYIYLLLGVVTGNLVITYQQTVSPRANIHFAKIIAPFSDDNAGACGNAMVQSLGIKEYLKAGIFYEYEKNGLKTSQTAVVNAESETAVAQSPASTLRFAENKFNDILDTVDAIQWYCRNNLSAFPDFNGQRMVVKASQFFI